MILGSGTGLWNGAYYDSVVPDQWKEDDCNGEKVCFIDTTGFGLRDDDWLYINYTCIASSTTRMAIENTVEVTPLPVDISN